METMSPRLANVSVVTVPVLTPEDSPTALVVTATEDKPEICVPLSEAVHEAAEAVWLTVTVWRASMSLQRFVMVKAAATDELLFDAV